MPNPPPGIARANPPVGQASTIAPRQIEAPGGPPNRPGSPAGPGSNGSTGGRRPASNPGYKSTGDTNPDTAVTDSRWGTAPSRGRIWYLLIATAGVLAIFSTCGIFSYYLVQDELAGHNAQTEITPPSPYVPRDISSREVDPEPLSADEVFPTDEIIINPAEPPYQVITTQENEDCSAVAADGLETLLSELGCTQVVRATLRSPTGDYLITSGVVNLATEDDAGQAYEDITPLIENGTGRFLGLLAGEGTESIVLSETVLFWDYRGHYLMYTVIARADGAEFTAADNKYADLISWDIIEVYLRSNVLEARATQPNPDIAQQGDGEPPAESADDE